MVDGGTTFGASTDVRAWAPEFRAALAVFRMLPTRAAARAARRAPPTVTVDFAPDGTDLRSATVRVTGTRSERLDLHFRDRAHVFLNFDTGDVTVEAKAPQLWAFGLDAWMRTWLLPVGSLLGLPVGSGQTWGRWRVRRVELCSDFTGIEFHLADSASFTGRAVGRTYDTVCTTTRTGEAVETIELSCRGRSAVSLSIHDKAAEQQARFGRTLRESIYAPTWLAHDWDGTKVVRVELRLKWTRGLLYRVEGDDGQTLGTIDLHEPASLLSRETLAQVWRSEMGRRRLTTRTDGRKRRNPIDPRWLVVQSAATVAEPLRLRHDREVQKLTHEQRVEREATRVVRSLASFANLQGMPTNEGAQLIERAPALVARALRCSDLDLPALAGSVAARDEFIAPECAAASAPAEADLSPAQHGTATDAVTEPHERSQ